MNKNVGVWLVIAYFWTVTMNRPANNSALNLAVQEAVRKAQEEHAKQKEGIMAQDKELKVNTKAIFEEIIVVISVPDFLTVQVDHSLLDKVPFKKKKRKSELFIVLFFHLTLSNFQGKSAEANKIREHNNEVQLKIKELEHNINKHCKDSQEAADKVQTHAEHRKSKINTVFFSKCDYYSNIILSSPRCLGPQNLLTSLPYVTLSFSRCLECWRNMTGSVPSASSSASPTLPMTLRPITPVRLASGWKSWRKPPPSWRGTSTRGPWTC